MTIGIMQPYFMPYIGYWQLLASVDIYVIYDDVNYIKKGWINRNNILVNNDKQLFTISLNGASQNKLINEITIADDFTKLRKTITMAYHKAPYYNNIMNLLDDIFEISKILFIMLFRLLALFSITMCVKNVEQKLGNKVTLKTNISENLPKEIYGDYSGIAIQYMFHYSRNKK